MEKVVYICLGSENETDDFALLTIHVSGKLAMFKSGNKNWCIIDDMPSVNDMLLPYDDAVLLSQRSIIPKKEYIPINNLKKKKKTK